MIFSVLTFNATNCMTFLHKSESLTEAPVGAKVDSDALCTLTGGSPMLAESSQSMLHPVYSYSFSSTIQH